MFKKPYKTNGFIIYVYYGNVLETLKDKWIIDNIINEWLMQTRFTT